MSETRTFTLRGNEFQLRAVDTPDSIVMKLTNTAEIVNGKKIKRDIGRLLSMLTKTGMKHITIEVVVEQAS